MHRLLPLLTWAIVTMVTVSGQFPDWLVTEITTTTSLIKTSSGNLQLTNGIIHREFSIKPDFATVDFYSQERQSSLLRAINPEAVILINGTTYNVGGFITSIPRAYLNRTALPLNMTFDPNAFHFVSYSTSAPEEPFPYTPQRGAPKDIVWPPKGLRLDVSFKAPSSAPPSHQMVTVTVHYEMYDGIPLLVKWLTVNALPEVANGTKVTIVCVELLGVNWQWADGGHKWLFVETDLPHGTSVQWQNDPELSSMPGAFAQQVNCTYSPNGGIPVNTGFDSFHVHELVIGSNDPERVSLSKHRLLRLLAPHTQENPIFFHLTNTTSAGIQLAVNQMAEVGFEMLIFSFGSGFNYESEDKTYIKQLADDVAYAKSKGIEVGGYDLIALTRNVQADWMAKPAPGETSQGACFASGWYDYLLEHITTMMEMTGMTMIETDGPYGGYSCSATNHEYHEGLEDSVYQQMTHQATFYRLLREKRVYINQPDNYFYDGGSKTGMGYNENQYSLPRWEDISISRQSVFEGTYTLIPSAGWMFLPLVQYHGGGSAATFEPLSEHLQEYEWGLAQYLGAGVAACYRGYRLYDTNTTKAVIIKWVSFYKKFRDILNSDIVHVRRADMQGVDAFMHVNPRLQTKALLMVFNPTEEATNTTLTVPLYYTGLTSYANVSEQAGTPSSIVLSRDYKIDLNIVLPSRGITWYLIQ